MTDVVIPGGRDVRGTLEDPALDGERPSKGGDGAEAIVVACPPHPQQGGHRGDRRLVAVCEALSERGVACLRFDYGEWDEGYGEREDTRNAIRWAAERYERVGVFGFSFGSAQAILASASLSGGLDVTEEPDDGGLEIGAASALAPPASLAPDLEVAPALSALDCPVQLCYGARDSTVDWEPVVSRGRELGLEVREFSADHFFVGQHAKVAEAVATFLETALVADP